MAGNSPDFFKCSSNATTLTVKGVQIGAQTLTQAAANSKTHIAGSVSPMYGIKPSLGKNTSPDIEMKHLAAIVAIKVVNNTNGSIIVRDVEFGIPEILDAKGAVTQSAYPIAGMFDITLPNLVTTPSETEGATQYSSVKVSLPANKDVTLTQGQSIIFYMPVRPFSDTKKVSIKVNGSSRTISKTLALSSGKVTTFNVPITDLQGSQITDALPMNGQRPFTSKADRDDSNIYDILNISGTKIEGGLIINGKQVDDVYQIGTAAGGVGKIVIQGYAREMINALPISFNVSSMDNEPAAMTISSVNALIPQYREKYDRTNTGLGTPYTKNYTSDVIYRKTLDKHGILGTSIAGSAAWVLLKFLGVSLDNGIQRSELVNFASGKTITFNNIPTNGYFSSGNVVVLDETNTNKSIQPGTIDYFLGEKFSTTTHTATFKGLYAIVNAKYKKDENSGQWKFEYDEYIEVVNGVTTKYTAEQMGNYAEQTAQAMLGRVEASLTARRMDDLLGLIADDYQDLMHMLRETRITIEISNYPYKNIYPDEEHLETGYKPIIVWGLDATLPSERN